MQVSSEDKRSVLSPEEKEKVKEFNNFTRSQRRKMERDKVVSQQQMIRLKQMRIKSMKATISEFVKVYQDSYTNYLRSGAPNPNQLREITLANDLEILQMDINEILNNTTNAEMEAIEAARIDRTDNIRCMYYRVDILLKFNLGATITDRPGVPEKTMDTPSGPEQQQLFYHALYPMPSDSNEVKIEAEYKLLADFMTHIFCMGIDMQQMNNANRWKQLLHNQTETLKSKADEVKEMFSKIGNDND